MRKFLHKPEAVILAAALAGVAVLIGQKIYAIQREHYYDPLAYKQLIKPEELAPLPVPQEAINKGRAVKIPILMYHHIGQAPAQSDPVRLDLTVPADNFAQQVKWLKSQGYTSISLKDIYLYSRGKFTLPKKPVVFSFDDGYDDAFKNAIGILDQNGFKGSFAIITQFVGTQQGTNSYASWQTVSQAYQDGQEIVSHTENHFDGKNRKFTSAYIYQNLSGSVGDIQKNLGFTTNILVYPYGHYTANYLAEAKKVGFVVGVTVHAGDTINLDDLMQLPRVRIHGKTDLARFEALVTE